MSGENRGDETIDMELTKLQIEYWTKRLEHTLAHTETSSRLIYFVDGAVLALLAFLVDKLGASRQVVLVMSFPMIVLAILNYLHSELVRIQHHWYSSIDEKLREKLGEAAISRPRRKFLRFSSTHGVYRTVHILIASALLIAAILMFLYGLGNFPEIN